MAWIFLVGLEESRLRLNRGRYQLPIVKSKDTLNQFCFPEWEKENSHLLQSGMTLQVCTGISYPYNPRLFMEGFRARISRLQENKRDLLKEKGVAYFLKFSDWLMKSIQNSFFSKMFLTSEPKDLTEFCKNLPKEGMIVDGQCYQLKKLEHVTKGNVGFSLPTPTAKNAPYNYQKNGAITEGLIRVLIPTLTCRDATTTQARPPERMIRMDGRNTLRISGMAETLMRKKDYPKTKFSIPTLGMNEYKGTGKDRFIGSKNFHGAKTSEGLRTCETDPTYLNPSFAEKIMGYLEGWTELNALGMQWFQSKFVKRLKN